MPKMKTKKSVAKRFKVTSNGKVKRKKGNKSHILTKKKAKRKRRLRKDGEVKGTRKKNIKKMMPYSF